MPIRYGQSSETDKKRTGLSFLAALRQTKGSGKVGALAASIAKGLCIGLVAGCFITCQAAAMDNATQISDPNSSISTNQVAAPGLAVGKQPTEASNPKRADFEGEHKSRNAQHVADWVVDSGDNHGMPFAIIDKTDAKVFVFDTDGRLRGAAPVLVGLAKGDEAIPGIGDRKLSDVRPEERTTPAGRFVASLGLNFKGKDILWVDYDGAVALHRVVTNNPKERRLERLASPNPREHRISYGCINVPAKFFDDVVKPTFTGTYCVVYILPETMSLSKTFESYYDVEPRGEAGATAELDEETISDPQQHGAKASRRKARP